jgi:hypothetical protein
MELTNNEQSECLLRQQLFIPTVNNCGLFVFVLCFVRPVLPVSLDWPFMPPPLFNFLLRSFSFSSERCNMEVYIVDQPACTHCPVCKIVLVMNASGKLPSFNYNHIFSEYLIYYRKNPSRKIYQRVGKGIYRKHNWRLSNMKPTNHRNELMCSWKVLLYWWHLSSYSC